MDQPEKPTFATDVSVKKGVISVPHQRRLGLFGDRLRCATIEGHTVFDVPVAELGELKAPFYYWGTAFKLRAQGATFVCSFLRSKGISSHYDDTARAIGSTARGVAEVADIPRARRVCQTWKDVIAEAHSS